MPQETLDAVLEDWTTAEIPGNMQAALKMLEYMTVHPLDIDHNLMSELREAGLSNLAIQEAANVGFHYNLIDRVADAFDFPVPQGIQQKRLARMLNITGGILRSSPAVEAWVEAEDGAIRPPEVEKGRQHLLSVEGETDPILRSDIEAFVYSQWGVDRGRSPDLPDALMNYLKKLSRYAYRITDDDLEALKAIGFTNDKIYEITLVGSVSAAMVGLDEVYKYLYGN